MKRTLTILLLSTALIAGCENDRRQHDFFSYPDNPKLLFRAKPTTLRPAGFNVYQCKDSNGEAFKCDDNFTEVFDNEYQGEPKRGGTKCTISDYDCQTKQYED